SGFADSRFITNAGEVEVTGSIESAGFEFEALIASTQHGEEIGLACYIGFFELLGLLKNEREELIASFSEQGSIGFHLTAGGVGFTGDLRSKRVFLQTCSLGTRGFLSDLALVAIPQWQRDGEAEADEAGTFSVLRRYVLLLAGCKETCAHALPALGFGELGFGWRSFSARLRELVIGALLPRIRAGQFCRSEAARESE
ncbi:MAG: hypothetical protein RL015_3406, partial [Verrucomicrobiota bacterium]